MRRLPDPRLYADPDHCLAWCRSLAPAGPPPAQPIPVHLWWCNAPGAKLLLGVKSFLATQDPRRFRLHLWLEDAAALRGAAGDPWLGPVLPLLELRRYDPAEATAGTPLAGDAWRTVELTPPIRADIARLALLWRHGGLYFDCDHVFLRDLAPLLAVVGDAEFAVQWSQRPWANTACLRLHAGSPAAAHLLARARAAGTPHPRAILPETDAPPGFLLLPSAVTDPLWLVDGGHARSAHAPFRRFPAFMKAFGRLFHRRRPEIRTLDDFFPGAFAYHWHNEWAAPERVDSYPGILDADVNRRLAPRLPPGTVLNAYGAFPRP